MLGIKYGKNVIFLHLPFSKGKHPSCYKLVKLSPIYINRLVKLSQGHISLYPFTLCTPYFLLTKKIFDFTLIMVKFQKFPCHSLRKFAS